MANSITAASPSSLAEVAAQVLAYMTAQTGVQSDANVGSQIRTLSEAVGQVAEEEGVIAQALAFQAVVYGCMSVFGITPYAAQSAVGVVTFAVSSGTATQNVLIPVGTVVQTAGGTQFQTTSAVTLSSGSASVNATVSAIIAGSAGNVAAGAVTTIVSGLTYPLYVSNAAAITGGSNAESPSTTLSRFTAKVLSIGLASPVAIANACVGVQPSGSTETVYYATVYEPWVYQSVGSQVAGFTVYIDNGSGTASSALISAVTTVLNGNYLTGALGFRDAGVPYSVAAVTPIYYSVTVTGTLSDSTQDAAAQLAVTAALQAYSLTLNFGTTVQLSQITAQVGDILANLATSFTVTLLNSSSASVTSIAIPVTQRAVLSSTSVTLS